MAYAGNNTPLVSVFEELGINDKDIEALVPMLNPAYQRPVMSKILDQFEGATIKNKERKFFIYRQPNDYPAATISGRTSLGSGSLRLTFTDSEFNSIANGNGVQAQSGAIGKFEKIDGGAIVSFYSNPNGNTSFVAADFASGEMLMDIGDIGNLENRETKETIFSLPDPSQNIIGTINASAYIGFEDLNNKQFLSSGDTMYYALQKEVQALGRLNQQYTKRQLSNTPAVFSGQEPMGASILNQILTMGGQQVSLGETSTFTESDLRNAIRQYKGAGGFTTDEVLVIGGSQYVGNWQEALANYVVQSGNRNTLGGQSITGINIMEYGFQGLHFKVITDPLLDNTRMFGVASNGFSRRSNSAMWMAVEPAKSENGGSLPFATCRYLGEKADIQRWIVPGSMDDKGNPVKTGANGKKGCMIEFTLDKQEAVSNPNSCLYHGSAN